MSLSELNIDVAIEQLLATAKPDYPEDHKAAMRVPHGGSSCSSCKYLADNKTDCTNEYFQKWHGSAVIPAPIDEFCSDWYEPNEDIEAYGTSEGVRKEWETRIRHAHGIDVDIFNRYSRPNPKAISVRTFLDHDPPPEAERVELAKKFLGAEKVGQEDVDIDKLTPLQTTVFKDKVEGIRTVGMHRTPIDVFRYKGKTYVIDGHHRLAVWALDQHDTIPANIYERHKEKDLEAGEMNAEALFRGIPIEGFTGPGEEAIRAAMSRVPPELLTNVKLVKATPELQPKHGRYDPETHTVNINPLIFNLRQRFGKGQGWIYHTELCMCHEIGHSIYYFLPEKMKDQWREISGWMVGTQDGQAPPYEETRPGWPPTTSKWTHREGAKFTRKYAKKNDDEDFADSFAFCILGKPHQMAPAKREFIDSIIKDRVKKYPTSGVQGPDKPYGERDLNAYGTSDGLEKAWDTRGRGRNTKLTLPKTDKPSEEPGYVGPKQTFYHGTISDAVKKVLETGVLKQAPDFKFNIKMNVFSEQVMKIPKGYIYLTKSKQTAMWYAELKARYEEAEPGSEVSMRCTDTPQEDCAHFYKPENAPPRVPGEKASIITFEIPYSKLGGLKKDPSSPDPRWEAFRMKGELPKDYISNVEQFDGHQWKQVWNPDKHTVDAGKTQQIYLVHYGKLLDVAKSIKGRNVSAGGPGSGCNPEVADPRCGRPSLGEKRTLKRSFRMGTNPRQLMRILKDGKSHSIDDLRRSGITTPRLDALLWSMRRTTRPLGFDIKVRNGTVKLVRTNPTANINNLQQTINRSAEKIRRDANNAPAGISQVLPLNQPPRNEPTPARTPSTTDRLYTDLTGRQPPQVQPNPNPDRKPKGFLAKDDKPPLDELTKDNIQISARDADKFETDFKMSPKDYKDELLQGISPDIAKNAELGIRQIGESKWSVQFSGPFDMTRNFSLDTGSVDHSYWRMNTLANQDYGKTIFSNSLDMYDHLGINKIWVHANMNVGGYAWARYGFVPDQGSWNSIRRSINYKLESNYNPIQLSADVKAQVKLIANITEPKAIWLLAALKDSKGESVGKKFLLGEDWNGSINLNDKENYSVVKAYVGSKHKKQVTAASELQAEPQYIVDGEKTDEPFHNDMLSSEEGAKASDVMASMFAVRNGWSLKDALKWFMHKSTK